MATAWKVVIGVACACTCGVVRADVVKLAELEARVLSDRPEVAMSAARIRQADAEIGAAQSGYLLAFPLVEIASPVRAGEAFSFRPFSA